MCLWVLKCAYFGATSNYNWVVRQYYMGKSRTVPSANSGFIGVKFVSDTLPGHVMDVAVAKNHALIRIRYRLNNGSHS